ncbi:hypothetical protein K1719_037550 [Acacia pycnantha]|nr:hypothetical protein K1719_037550 [Acacia pycnantha]
MEYLERRLSALKPNHVYISFDDDDTRKFVRSLSAALKAQGFRIFGHHEKRKTGVSNNFPYYQLLEAIEESWIWIVVFSKFSLSFPSSLLSTGTLCAISNVLFKKANLTFEGGEKIDIIGPNGCGNITLLNLIMGLGKPNGGEVVLGEHNVLPNYFELYKLSPSQFEVHAGCTSRKKPYAYIFKSNGGVSP